jgi:hypothetical protein
MYRLFLVGLVVSVLAACQGTGDGKQSKTLGGQSINLSKPYEIRNSSFTAADDIPDLGAIRRSDRNNGGIFTEYYYVGLARRVTIEHNTLGFFSDNSTDMLISRKGFMDFLSRVSLQQLNSHIRYLEWPSGRGHVAENDTCSAAVFAKRLKTKTFYSNDRGQPDTAIYVGYCGKMHSSIENFIYNLEFED